MKVIITAILMSLSTLSHGQQTAVPEVNPTAVALYIKTFPFGKHINNPDSCNLALAILDSATRIDTNYFYAYERKLPFLGSLKQHKRAIVTLEKLISLRPDKPYLYVSVGMCYQQLKDTASAYPYLERAIVVTDQVLQTTNPADPEYTWLGYNKALALHYLGRISESREVIKKVHQKEEADLRAYGTDWHELEVKKLP